MAKTQTRHQPSKKRPQARPKSGPRKKQQQPWYREYTWLPWVVGFVVLGVVVIALRSGQTDAPAPGVAVSKPVVGGDLHSLVVSPDDPGKLYIGSHQGVSISTDGGETWEVVESLNGADAMGWAFTDDAILVGGHPGLSVSTDGGKTFEQRNDGLPSTDVHALGAGGEVMYAGLAGVGTFASTDDGKSWEARSEEVGGAFMGRIQVDPSNDEHLLAPDMGGGAMESTDGGRTWESLGGVQGAMWVSWDENDTDHMIVTTLGSAAESIDGGEIWEPLEIPQGASIVEFSPHDPDLLFAAVLEVPEASVYVSRDGGDTWVRP
ncbi:MAG TPA: hypothetical protein VFF07_07825 [Actinomycetota bacterium]|nr:hypothetical protein [Actinomycetota bacterium]